MPAVAAFAAWTVFVWATRVRNIVRDEGSTFDLVVAVGVAGLGVLLAVAVARRRPQWPLLALVVATVATWAVRAPLILVDADHGTAFKAVHLALAVASLALAALAWRARAVLVGPATGSPRAGATRGG